jgi:hypothetical protein
MNAKKIGYYLTTVLFSLMMLGSAGAYLTRQPPLVEAFTHLGYPLYFMTILGVAKLLGALALLIPVIPRTLREWAYAGFVFNLISAVASHVASGDPIGDTIAPIIPMTLLLASYALWRSGAANATTSSAPALA